MNPIFTIQVRLPHVERVALIEIFRLNYFLTRHLNNKVLKTKYIFYLDFLLCLFFAVFHDIDTDNRLHYPLASSPSNGVMASPTATRFNTGEHQLHNHMQHHQSVLQQQQRHHQMPSNARLPPDLLPYGQHQSLALTNSLNNSSSSGSSSGGSTVIIDHRTQTYSSNNKYEAYAASYDDDVIDAMKNMGKDTDDGRDDDLDDGDFGGGCSGSGDSDSSRLFLSEKHSIRRPSDEPDLRIYHHDIVVGGANNSIKSTTSPKPFSLLGSSCTTTMTIASGKTTTLLPSHRFKNYELSTTVTTPAATTIPSKNNNYPFYNNGTMAGSTVVVTTSTHQAVPTMQTHFKSTESSSNTSTANCKPRQSIVRTSPSFSFLSTGYHQQQDNFL